MWLTGFWLVDLDQIAAGVGEDRYLHRAGVARVHRELAPFFLQAPRLRVDIVNLKRGDRNSFFEDCFLERLGNGIGVGFQDQFHVRISVG